MWRKSCLAETEMIDPLDVFCMVFVLPKFNLCDRQSDSGMFMMESVSDTVSFVVFPSTCTEESVTRHVG